MNKIVNAEDLPSDLADHMDEARHELKRVEIFEPEFGTATPTPTTTCKPSPTTSIA